MHGEKTELASLRKRMEGLAQFGFTCFTVLSSHAASLAKQLTSKPTETKPFHLEGDVIHFKFSIS
jgi:streptomycin 6-kinase